jgi:hypothetical protein
MKINFRENAKTKIFVSTLWVQMGSDGFNTPPPPVPALRGVYKTFNDFLGSGESEKWQVFTSVRKRAASLFDWTPAPLPYKGAWFGSNPLSIGVLRWYS